MILRSRAVAEIVRSALARFRNSHACGKARVPNSLIFFRLGQRPMTNLRRSILGLIASAPARNDA